MTPLDLAALLKDYGPWGLLALSLLTVRVLFGKYEKAQQARIEDYKLYAGALKDAAESIEKNNEQNVDLLALVSSIKLLVETRRGRS